MGAYIFKSGRILSSHLLSVKHLGSRDSAISRIIEEGEGQQAGGSEENELEEYFWGQRYGAREVTAQQVRSKDATSRNRNKRGSVRGGIFPRGKRVRKAEKQRGGAWKPALRGAKGGEVRGGRSGQAQGARSMGVREASKMRRVRLKARERVSEMSMALAVLARPKACERLSWRRAWVALRLSA